MHTKELCEYGNIALNKILHWISVVSIAQIVFHVGTGNLVPETSFENSPFRGLDGTLIMLWALVRQHFTAVFWIGRSEVPIIFFCCLPIGDTTSPWPDRDAVGQYALYSASVKGGENGRGEVCSLLDGGPFFMWGFRPQIKKRVGRRVRWLTFIYYLYTYLPIYLLPLLLQLTLQYSEKRSSNTCV